jgi:hypothetical protein
MIRRVGRLEEEAAVCESVEAINLGLAESFSPMM